MGLLSYQDYKIKSLDYDEYWQFRLKNDSIDELRKRDYLISDLIMPGASILDIGCGNGRLLNYLIKTKSVDASGIDNSNTAVSFATNNGLDVKHEDIMSASFCIKKEHDHIILSDVLEHIADPEKVMNKVWNKFRISLLITLPNIGHLSYRLRFLLGRFPECWKWHPGEHIRHWTKKDFTHFLCSDENGFPSMIKFRFISISSTPLLNLVSSSLFSYNYLVEVKK